MNGGLEATGYAPAYDAFCIPGPIFPGSGLNMAAVDGQISKFTILCKNLNQMLRAVMRLQKDPNYKPYFTPETNALAQRLAWLVAYFYSGVARFDSWILDLPKSAARANASQWSSHVAEISNLFETLTSMPDTWFTGVENLQEEDTPTKVPAEAPLELVVQIYLNVYDKAHIPPYSNGLTTPEVVQNCLRNELSLANGFETRRQKRLLTGFSLCIFVSQSTADATNRNLLAGSTVPLLAPLNFDELATNFKDLRRMRFKSGGAFFDTELQERFRDTSQLNARSNPLTSPRRRFESLGWRDDSSGEENLKSFVNRAIDTLTNEYTNLPPGQRKEWLPFTYSGQDARANFAPNMFNWQKSWFIPTPRCMKCRVIHGFAIENEDLAVRAGANDSCQCAEDICYGKLRQLGLVQNVVLPARPQRRSSF